MSKIRKYSDKLFCLKQIAVGEADAVFIVFSEKEGKISVFAKGIRKIKSKKRGNIIPGFISEVVLYKGQGMPVLLESSLKEGFEFLDETQNVSRILFFLKKVLPEAIPEPEIFGEIQDLVKKEKLDFYAVNKFRIRVLQMLGFLQDLRVCSKCFDEKSQVLSLADFSTYCDSCYTSIKQNNVVRLDKISYRSPILTDALDNWIKTAL